jgi:hypothetical protein
VEWVVREGVGAGGRNDPSLYAHMNKKNNNKKNYLAYFNSDTFIFLQDWGLNQGLMHGR